MEDNKISEEQPMTKENKAFNQYLLSARSQFCTTARLYTVTDHLVLRTEIDSLLIAYDQAVSEIDRLNKEVKRLKLINSESLEYISRIIELIRLGHSINIERRLKHVKRIVEEGASCIYECDLTTSMNCRHCGKSKWQHSNQ